MFDREPKEIDVMSAHTMGVSQSLKAKLPLGTLPLFGESMEKVAESIAYDPYDDFGNEITGMRRIMEEDIDFESVIGKDCVTHMTTLTTFPFELHRLDGLPNDTDKAMNSHYITGLSLAQSRLPANANVLVYCAGKGNDVVRLTYRGLPSFANLDIVGASPFRQLAKFAVRNVPGKVRIFNQYAEDVPIGEFLPKYDLILCHHGLHHVMRSKRGVSRLLELLDRLTPNGLFVGDKVDPVGLDTMAQYSFMPASGVELCEYSHDKYIEGAFNLRINDRIWEDPVLSDRRMFDTLQGFNVNVLQGRGAFQVGYNIFGDKFIPPKSVLQSSKSCVTRVVTYVEIAKFSNRMINPPMALPDFPPHTYILSPRERFEDGIMDLFNFRVNRGLHLQVVDIPYVGINSIYAEKTNGLLARVVVGEGCIYVMTQEADPRYFVGHGKTRNGLPILRLQCELVEKYSATRLILCDPIHMGIDCPTGFRSRLNYYDAMVRTSPWISQYITTKTWYSTIPAEATWWEGVVVMGCSTPSPSVGEKYAHTARYAKWINTVDLLFSDGIWEVNVITDERIRPRPDKIKPNSPANVKHVEQALTLYDLLSILEISHDIEVEARDLAIQANLHTIEPLPGILVALRYPNRAAKDRDAMRTKLQLLENIGYAPPHTYSVFAGIDEVPDVTGWLLDIGTEGGNGHSKGDGPGLELLAEVASQERTILRVSGLRKLATEIPFGGVVREPLPLSPWTWNSNVTNIMHKGTFHKLLDQCWNYSSQQGGGVGKLCLLEGTKFPMFKVGKKEFVVVHLDLPGEMVMTWIIINRELDHQWCARFKDVIGLVDREFVDMGQFK